MLRRLIRAILKPLRRLRLRTRLGMVLIFMTFLTELHGFVNDHWPDWAQTKVNVFLSPSYHIWVNENPKYLMERQWYIKFLCDDIYNVIVFLVAAIVAMKYSVKMAFIFLIYFLYSGIDMFLFMWNNKQDKTIYAVMLYASLIATLILIVPYKEKLHAVK